MSDSSRQIDIRNILGNVVCTPQNPRVGESVLVEVKARDGRIYAVDDDVFVSINGTPGARQWLQWTKPGIKRIFVIARKSSVRPERMIVNLDIRAAAGEENVFPILHIKQRLDQPYMVDFSLDGLPNAAHTEWDFGNAQTVSARHSVVSHDFAPSLSSSRLLQSFDVSATTVLPGGRTVQVHRTITFLNHYVYAKQRGIIQPPVNSDMKAVVEEGRFLAALTVHNHEDSPITLKSRRMQAISHGDQAVPMTAEVCRTIIPGKTSHKIEIVFPIDRIPAESCGFAVHFAGMMGLLPVRCSAFFDIPERFGCKEIEETNRRFVPNRFLNACKGDVVLAPTADTLIGDIDALRALAPAQLCSRFGIMTANYTQIAHSTASQDTTKADTGVVPVFVHPFVAKPDPMLETQEIRAKLHQAADRTLAQTRMAHNAASHGLYGYFEPLVYRPQRSEPVTVHNRKVAESG